MDTPALNTHSRAVLIPLATAQLPPSFIKVPGPGPNESHLTKPDAEPSEAEGGAEDATPPPVPKTSLPDVDDEDGEDLASDQEEDAVNTAGRTDRDPYSNLDGAFGNYIADEPRPMGANGQGGRNDDDDLLF